MVRLSLGLGGSGLCAYKLFRSALWSIWSGVVSYVVGRDDVDV